MVNITYACHRVQITGLSDERFGRYQLGIEAGEELYEPLTTFRFTILSDNSLNIFIANVKIKLPFGSYTIQSAAPTDKKDLKIRLNQIFRGMTIDYTQSPEGVII